MSKASEWAKEDQERVFYRLKSYDLPRGAFSSVVARVLSYQNLQIIEGRESGVWSMVTLSRERAVELAHWILDTWIIKGVKGEFYPCKPDVFAATYEPVDA